MEEEMLGKIVEPLLKWFQEKGRKLPWREGREAYKIWLSEIMLQQTRIEAVKNYYERFICELPTISDLAKVEEEKLLKLWEGLGYYNRARNLKKAAIQIVENYQGEMPKTYQELLQLPGIGEYTAGAIASIAYQEKVPAVDGNVLRVISRILASKEDNLLPQTKKKVTQYLQKIMPTEAGMFNEALMELGETVCIPNGDPLCSQCPVKELCLAKDRKLVQEIPVREKRNTRKKEERVVFLLVCGDRIAIRKRSEKGLLAGMYEFPNIIGKGSEVQIQEVLRQWKIEPIKIQKLRTQNHIFSHVEWEMNVVRVDVHKINEEFMWIEKKEWEINYPMPTAFAKLKKEIED